MRNGQTKIEILDSTLRDGAQGEGISYSVADKLAIARELDALGIDYIECGNPASNPKDREFFELAAGLELANARLVAFGATRRKGVAAQEDEGLAALAEAGTGIVSVFGKCWDMHVTQVLQTTREENRAMIRESCRFLRDCGKEVFFDAEHFFDGYKSDPEFALDMLRAAAEGGAEVLVLCDTNGGGFPDEMAEITRKVCALMPKLTIGVHFHNDSGMAVASSVLAAGAGAGHIQGTLLGIGERCGNAELSAIIPNLQLKRSVKLIPDCAALVPACRAVAEICNINMTRGEPYVGSSAFAHKAGMHADAVLKNPASFEHVKPESVGNKRRLLLSEMSGRGALSAELYTLLPGGGDERTVRVVLDRLKELEHEGYQFEGAHASFELMVRKCTGSYKPFFELRNYRIICAQPHDPDCSAAAMVKIRVDGEDVLRSGEGKGPIDALNKALRLALRVFYPQLSEMRLVDYKVRVMDSKEATAARVRVMITSSDGRREWSTVGVSCDIIEASWTALCDSIEYKLALPPQKDSGK